MKVETLEHLVEWAGEIHQRLGAELKVLADHADEGTMQWFAQYAGKHEAQMAEQIVDVAQEADAKALHTYVYDWIEHPPLNPSHIHEAVGESTNFDTLSQAVFEIHGEIVKLLQPLKTRAIIPEAKELIDQILSLEDGHARQIAHQANRIGDM